MYTSNNSIGWSNSVGWQISSNFITVQDGIIEQFARNQKSKLFFQENLSSDIFENLSPSSFKKEYLLTRQMSKFSHR